MSIARGAEDAKIMLTDGNLLDEHAKKWLVKMKKEINERKKYKAARAAMAAAEHVARIQAEQEARMREEHASWMASTRVIRPDSD